MAKVHVQRPYGTNVCITGASSGIGLACARLFAQEGFRVWGTNRSGTTDQVLPEGVNLSSMDVTDTTSVREGVNRIWQQAIHQTGKGIGIVVHCAGFGIGGAAEDTNIEEVRSQFETNYFGLLRVNQTLLPLMRAHGPALVIVLGSIAGRLSIPFQSHYSATKFAVEAYVEALRLEGRPYGISATVIEAGDTSTPFTAKRRIVLPPDSPYTEQARKAIAKMERDEQHGYEPKFVAQVVWRVAQLRKPPVRKAVGLGYTLLLFLRRLLPDRLVEYIIGIMYLGSQKSGE